MDVFKGFSLPPEIKLAQIFVQLENLESLSNKL
jgi:hypothetical protein